MLQGLIIRKLLPGGARIRGIALDPKTLEFDRIGSAQVNPANQAVFQLPNISWPVPGHQDGRGTQLERLLIQRGMLGEKAVCEQEHILLSFAEGWELNTKDGKTIKEVGTKRAHADEVLDGGIRRGDEPHICGTLDARPPAPGTTCPEELAAGTKTYLAARYVKNALATA